MIVVDTSVWIDFFRDEPTREVEFLSAQIDADAGVALTDVVLTELLQGARDERQARRLERRMRSFEVLRLETIEDFRRSAYLYRLARTHGVTIRRAIDCLIASVCVREDVPILHDDADFDRLASCTDLRVVEVPSPSG